jgi:signal peptidase I
MAGKEAWLAVNLSMFFPGIGQLYAEKLRKGLFWLIAVGILIAIAAWSIFGANGNTLTGILLLLLVGGIYLINLFDAYHCVTQSSPRKRGERIPRKQKDPWFAVFLSRLLPGLGQLYEGKSLMGAVLLFCFVFFGLIDDTYTGFTSLPPILTAVGAYHAYAAFPRRGRRRSRRALIAVMASLILALGLISTSLPAWIKQEVEPFNIPSESMQPTLQVGDQILVTQSDYYSPKQRDIIVFKAPPSAQDPESEYLDENGNLYYVKRIIGTPAQRVEISEGRVYLNGVPLAESYLAEMPAYQWGPQIVPPDTYFVLGDNRNNSFDSHVWGFVPRENIVGEAYKIYWPPERIQPLSIISPTLTLPSAINSSNAFAVVDLAN